MKDWLYRFWKYLRTEIQNLRPGIKKDIWKWINRIFFSGIWLQPFAMAGLILFFQKVLGGDVSYLILFVLSFLPSGYVWSENQRQAAAGKVDFSIEDVFHEKPNEFSSPLKQKAMYPRIAEDFLFDQPQGVVFGRTEEGYFKKEQKYLCKPMDAAHYKDGHVFVIGGSGSGKSSALVIPSLLASQNAGGFYVDIKGELWRKSRRMDAEDVVIIDFQDRGKWGWDALYLLNHKGGRVTDQDIRETMEEIANSLIPISAKDTDQFWKQSGRSLLVGELVGLYKQKKIHNLSELVNEILSRDAKELVEELLDGAAPRATETKFLSSFRNLAEETMSGVVQQESESLRIFIDLDVQYGLSINPRQANTQMLEEGKAVFLAIPEEKLEVYYNLVNLIIAQVFGSLIKRPEGSRPVMVVIDEMARICARGPVPYLHSGILLTGRSRNITLILITQSFEALENAYTKADIQSMVANSAYLVCLDVRSPSTAKTICGMAGTYKERQTTWSGSGKNRSVSISYQDKPVLEPSDLSRLVKQDEVVIISADYGYCKARKCSYFNDAVLGPMSEKVQRYNREAMGIEGKEEIKETKRPIPILPERPEDCREKLIRLAEKGYETLRESIHRQYEGGKEKWKKKTKSDCKKQ